jgi:Cu2+-exporting ATPase
MGIATREFLHWTSALIAVPSIIFSGRPFFNSALSALKSLRTNMDVPISVALILTCAVSFLELINKGEHVYFDSAVMLMFFLLVGRYLDFKARRKARSLAYDLMNTFDEFATVLENKKSRQVLAKNLKEGMIILVKRGEKFLADGIVISDQGSVDTSVITGETTPAHIHKNSIVYAGSINLGNPVTYTCKKPSESSTLAEIAQLLENAENKRHKYKRIADRVAQLYTPVVHIAALLTFCLWYFLIDVSWQEALLISITVLIITCPCAIGLAVPVAQVVATNILFKMGVILKSGDALEKLSEVDTVFFDKTGTLTQGTLEVEDISDSTDIQIAASLASYSLHPISQIISKSFQGELIDVSQIKETPGYGIEGIIQDKAVKLGKRSWVIKDNEHDICEKNVPEASTWLHIEGLLQAKPIILKDHLKEDSKHTVHAFSHDGLNTIIVSGDQYSFTQAIAHDLGINTFYANLLPKDKYELIQDYQTNNHKVLMVGDGLNDTPSMTKADVSIAPSNAVALSVNTADIVILNDKLYPVYETYALSKKVSRVIKQNFILSFAYNLIAIPLAIAGLVTPFIAAIAMSSSSLLVIGNSFRLKGMKS